MFRSSLGLLPIPASPEAPSVILVPLRNNTIIWLISSGSTSPEFQPGANAMQPGSLPMHRLQPAVNLRTTDATGVVDCPPVVQLFQNEFNTDDGCNNLQDNCGAKAKAPMGHKYTEFSVKQFAKSMGQRNFSSFSKWQNVQDVRILEKMHWSIFWGQNHQEMLQDGPLHWIILIAEDLEKLEEWLSLENLKMPIGLCNSKTRWL